MVAGTPVAQVALIEPLAVGVVPGAIVVPNAIGAADVTVVQPATTVPVTMRLVVAVDVAVAEATSGERAAAEAAAVMRIFLNELSSFGYGSKALP
jgi:hypothetical protein